MPDSSRLPTKADISGTPGDEGGVRREEREVARCDAEKSAEEIPQERRGVPGASLPPNRSLTGPHYTRANFRGISPTTLSDMKEDNDYGDFLAYVGREVVPADHTSNPGAYTSTQAGSLPQDGPLGASAGASRRGMLQREPARRKHLRAGGVMMPDRTPFPAGGATRRSSTESIDRRLQSVRMRSEKPEAARENILESIQKNLLFKGCSTEELNAIVEAFEPESFASDAVVIKQGDEGKYFYVVEAGTLEVFVTADHETMRVGTPIAAGASFGELALMHNAPRAATIRALTACSLWRIDRQTFRDIKRHLREEERLARERIIKGASVMGKPLTEMLDPQVLSTMAAMTQRQTFEKGDVIMREGGDGDTMYYIIEGHAEVFKANAGPEPLACLGPGELFGEKAIKSATVIAVSKVSCLSLSHETVVRNFGGLEQFVRAGVDDGDDKSQAEPATLGIPPSSKTKEDYKPDVVDWKLSDLEMGATLGMGAFGRVRLVKMRDTGENYALKIVSKAKIFKLNLQEAIAREHKCLALLDHPFIVRYFGAIQSKSQIYFRTEFLQGGELFSILQLQVRLPENVAKFFAASLLLAFEHIHSHNVVYRDLKVENIVLDSNGYIKLVDFGNAKELVWQTWTYCGTPDYMSPEVILNEGHGKGVDYWALGVLIYEIVSGAMPFVGESQMDLFKQITANNYRKDSRYFRHSLVDLITQLLQNDPNKRIGNIYGGAQAVMKHRWFGEFDWDGLSKMEMKVPIKPKVKDVDDTSNFDTFAEDDDSDVLDDPVDWVPDFANFDETDMVEKKLCTKLRSSVAIEQKSSAQSNQAITIQSEGDLGSGGLRNQGRYRNMTTAPIYVKDNRNVRTRLKSTYRWFNHQNNRSNLDNKVNSYGFGTAMLACPQVNMDLEPVNILCMDGGGMKGFALIAMLDSVSKLCGGRELSSMFDLYGGTSVGGIAALQMGHRKTFREGFEEALVWSEKMRMGSFGKKSYVKMLTKGSLFNDERETIFKDMFGQRSTYLDHEQHGGLRSFAVCVRRELSEGASSNENKVEPFILRTYNLSEVSEDKSPISGTHKLPLYLSMLATSAAPWAFERTVAKVKGKNYQLCDGMLLQNSPVIIAVREAKLLWPNRSIGTIVSLGLDQDEEESIHDAMGMIENLNPHMKYFRLMPPIDGMSATEVDLAVLNEYQRVTREFMMSSSLAKEACESIMQRKCTSEVEKCISPSVATSAIGKASWERESALATYDEEEEEDLEHPSTIYNEEVDLEDSDEDSVELAFGFIF